MASSNDTPKNNRKRKPEKPTQLIKGVGKTVSAGASKVKSSVVENIPTITPEQMMEVLDKCYDHALEGIPNISKPVHDLAYDYLSKYKDPGKAANALINAQLIKCTTSGFLSGLGGLITLPVTVPANVSSVMYVQLRMIAAIAEIGGYDSRSDQVQAMAYACLTGQAVETVLKNAGIKIGNNLAMNGVKKISGAALAKINKAVGFRLVTKFGETGIINMGKAVPIVGGFIGGGFDLASTKIIANNACKMFLGTVYDDTELNNALNKGTGQSNQKAPDLICIPSSSKKYIGRQYKEVANELRDAGFKNIICSNVADLKKGWLAKEGSIARISVAGQTEFKKDIQVSKDATIRITFHTYK